jgi:ribose 5-phosphate isomerase
VDAQIEQEKRLAAESAAALVESGMRVGLGTGSTVAYLIPALAEPTPKRRRGRSGSPSGRSPWTVSTSPSTAPIR